MQLGSQQLTERLLKESGAIVSIAPQAAETLARIERITLLGEGLDVQHCLLAERGVMRYPPYERLRSQPAFETRAQLLEYEDALQVPVLLACLCSNAH